MDGSGSLPSVESGQACTCIPSRHPGLGDDHSIARGLLPLDKNGDRRSHSAETAWLFPRYTPSSQRLIDIDLGGENPYPCLVCLELVHLYAIEYHHHHYCK